MYRQMHEDGEGNLGLKPEDTLIGRSLFAQARRIKGLIDRVSAETLLDYGSGKGRSMIRLLSR